MAPLVPTCFTPSKQLGLLQNSLTGLRVTLSLLLEGILAATRNTPSFSHENSSVLGGAGGLEQEEDGGRAFPRGRKAATRHHAGGGKILHIAGGLELEALDWGHNLGAQKAAATWRSLPSGLCSGCSSGPLRVTMPRPPSLPAPEGGEVREACVLPGSPQPSCERLISPGEGGE